MAKLFVLGCHARYKREAPILESIAHAVDEDMARAIMTRKRISKRMQDRVIELARRQMQWECDVSRGKEVCGFRIPEKQAKSRDEDGTFRSWQVKSLKKHDSAGSVGMVEAQRVLPWGDSVECQRRIRENGGKIPHLPSTTKDEAEAILYAVFGHKGPAKQPGELPPREKMIIPPKRNKEYKPEYNEVETDR